MLELRVIQTDLRHETIRRLPYIEWRLLSSTRKPWALQ